MTKKAIIVLFHGSRAEGAGATVRRIVGEVARRSGYDIVMEAFLRHAAPTLEDAIHCCVTGHAERIVIVPFFLQTGVHVTADVPAIVSKARALHPACSIIVTDAVGSHPLMADIVLDLANKTH